MNDEVKLFWQQKRMLRFCAAATGFQTAKQHHQQQQHITIHNETLSK